MTRPGALFMTGLMGGLFLLGLGLILWGLYMVFSPQYNTTEDYTALVPLFEGAVIWGVDLVILLAYGLYHAVVR